MASEIQACATDPHPWGCCLRSGCFPTLFKQIQVWHTSSCTSGSSGLGAFWSHPFSSGEENLHPDVPSLFLIHLPKFIPF